MYHIINSDALLACLLKNRNRPVSYQELRKFSEEIARKNPSIITDISGKSVDSALYYYPALFIQKNSDIERAEKSEEYYNSDYIEFEFFFGLPNDIKKVIFEDYALVGGQSTVAPGTIVGRDTVLGACLNTAFNQLCEPSWVYAGIPARKLKRNKYAEERRDIIIKTDVDEEQQYEVESEVNIDEDKKDMV